MVGVGEGEMMSRVRIVRTEVRDIRTSHDEILQLERSRRCNFGKW